jgi:hypothetical protein
MRNGFIHSGGGKKMIYKQTRRAKDVHSTIIILKKPYFYRNIAQKINDATTRALEKLSSKKKT